MKYRFRLKFPNWGYLEQVEKVTGEWWKTPEFSGYPEFSPKWEDVPDDPDDHLGEWRAHERSAVFFLVQTVRLILGFRYLKETAMAQVAGRPPPAFFEGDEPEEDEEETEGEEDELLQDDG